MLDFKLISRNIILNLFQKNLIFKNIQFKNWLFLIFKFRNLFCLFTVLFFVNFGFSSDQGEGTSENPTESDAGEQQSEQRQSTKKEETESDAGEQQSEQRQSTKKEEVENSCIFSSVTETKGEGDNSIPECLASNFLDIYTNFLFNSKGESEDKLTCDAFRIKTIDSALREFQQNEIKKLKQSVDNVLFYGKKECVCCSGPERCFLKKAGGFAEMLNAIGGPTAVAGLGAAAGGYKDVCKALQAFEFSLSALNSYAGTQCKTRGHLCRSKHSKCMGALDELKNHLEDEQTKLLGCKGADETAIGRIQDQIPKILTKIENFKEKLGKGIEENCSVASSAGNKLLLAGGGYGLAGLISKKCAEDDDSDHPCAVDPNSDECHCYRFGDTAQPQRCIEECKAEPRSCACWEAIFPFNDPEKCPYNETKPEDPEVEDPPDDNPDGLTSIEPPGTDLRPDTNKCLDDPFAPGCQSGLPPLDPNLLDTDEPPAAPSSNPDSPNYRTGGGPGSGLNGGLGDGGLGGGPGESDDESNEQEDDPYNTLLDGISPVSNRGGGLTPVSGSGRGGSKSGGDSDSGRKLSQKEQDEKNKNRNKQLDRSLSIFQMNSKLIKTYCSKKNC